VLITFSFRWNGPNHTDMKAYKELHSRLYEYALQETFLFFFAAVVNILFVNLEDFLPEVDER